MKKVLYSVALAALLCACTPSLVPDKIETPAEPESVEQTELKGTAYIIFTEEAASKIEAGNYPVTKAGVGIKSMHRIIPDGSEFDKRHHEAGLHRWYTVEFDSEIPNTKASEMLQQLDGVVNISFPNKIQFTSSSYFNDPYLGSQWNLYNEQNGCDINVVPVWQNYTSGSKNVLVAVLDSGVDVEH